MRTGIFGGTFDPIHSTHLAMARAAADQMDLDEVLFIPTGNPPHKSTGTPFEDRFRMVELACDADWRFVPSRIEEGNSKSYSINTIERLRAQKTTPDVLFFIIGADAYEEIQTWHRWQDVVASVEFIVIGRPGHAIPEIPGARAHRVEMAESDVSSSEIRRELAVGKVPAALPAAVAEYIHEHKLYAQ